MTSERAERTVSVNDTDKFCEAVCAFANDMPDNKQNGYLLVGVHDDGRLSGLKATDSLLKNLAAIRSVRDYRSTGPTMFHQYAARIELLNSGGLYGRVNQWKKKGLFNCVFRVNQNPKTLKLTIAKATRAFGRSTECVMSVSF